MSIEKKLLEIACPLALTVDRTNKHVSIITHGSKILSIGTNARRTHTLARQIGYWHDEPHSELDAWIRLDRCHKSKPLTLWNFRYNRFREMRMAKPCKKCQGWCLPVFKTIMYSTPEGVMEKL